LSRGAVGSILISGRKGDSSWDKKRLSYGFEEVKLAYSPTSLLNILTPFEVAESFFIGAQYSLEQIRQLDERDDMRSFPLASRLRFNGKYAERDFVARNVIGLIPGTNNRLSDEYLLLTAHYDHLGIGPPMKGDSIYNGVFDNAAGVAALLEIGRMIALEPLQRSMLLVFVSGEERGLLGSLYYVDHAVRPLYKTVANINIDGISVFEPFREVIGVGGTLSNLGNLLTSFVTQSGIRILEEGQVKNSQALFTRSDQIVFARAGIPSILVIEGNEYQTSDRLAGRKRMEQWVSNIYHTPFDDLSQPINYAAVEQHVTLLEKFTRIVATAEEEIEWNPRIPYRIERFRSRAEKR
ncbi:MAG: M28 family peptidase, partial [Calditrichota bacterium]